MLPTPVPGTRLTKKHKDKMAPQECFGRSNQSLAHFGGGKVPAPLQLGAVDPLGHQVIQRFPQQKRRMEAFDPEEQKGKWRRRESSLDSKTKEDFQSMEMMQKEVGEKVVEDKEQVVDDVTMLMMKVAEKLAQFAVNQSLDKLAGMGLD